MPDIETLRLCSLLNAFSFGMIFLTLWLGRRAERHLAIWAGSAFLYGLTLIGLGTFGHAGLVPGALFLALLALSNLMSVIGLRQFQGRALFAPWMILPLLIAMLAHVATALLIDAGVFDARYGEAGDALGLAAAMLISGLAMAMGPARGQRIAGLAMLCYLPGFAIVAVTTVTGIASSQLALVPMLADQVLLAMLHLGLLAIPFDEAQARLRQAALRDPLTGVWNRAGLAEQKSRLWAREAGVLAIDVDNFKTVNDRHGHAEGDRVLVGIAQEAARLATASDGIVARTGGDEFVMLLPGGEAELTRVATALLASLRSAQAPPATWSLSLGLAVVAEGEGDFEPALQRADAALYRAKDGGRDRLAA